MNEVIEETEETTAAYKEYMELANAYFEHLKKKTSPPPEEAGKIQKRQDILWEQMTDDEKWQADDTILRTTLWICNSK